MTTEKLQTFTGQLEQWVAEGLLPGAHCLVTSTDPASGKRLVSDTLVGYADVEQQVALNEHSLFRLASASKLFVSAGCLTLIEAGELSLSDPVHSVLPEYEFLTCFDADGNAQAAKQVMTIEDLLRHSCGYGYGDEDSGDEGPGNEEPAYRKALMEAGLLGTDSHGDHWVHDYSLRQWAAKLATVPMESEPGCRVSYGLGHDILGAVIEVVTGQTLDHFLQQRLFLPLGLNDTFFTVPEDRISDLTNFYDFRDGQLELLETAKQSAFTRSPKAFSGGGGWDMLGNGGLVSSTADMTTLLQFILNSGKQNETQLIEPALVNRLKMGASYSLEISEMLPGCSYSFGIARVDDTERYAGAGPLGKMFWGGSTNTYFYYLPEQKQLGVFLTHTFPFAHLNAIYRFSGLSSD